MRSAAAFAALAAGALLAASLARAQEPPPPPAPTPPAPQPAEPPPDPKLVLEGVCTSCHGLDFIAEHRKTRDDWDFTVRRMIDKGAELDLDTAAVLIDYLAKTYPPPDKPPEANPQG